MAHVERKTHFDDPDGYWVQTQPQGPFSWKYGSFPKQGDPNIDPKIL